LCPRNAKLSTWGLARPRACSLILELGRWDHRLRTTPDGQSFSPGKNLRIEIRPRDSNIVALGADVELWCRVPSQKDTVAQGLTPLQDVRQPVFGETDDVTASYQARIQE
jgi:hypothetical protein